jgi:hypothetical protein
MRIGFAIGAAGLLAAAMAARADEGCSKDSECAGDRICVERQCVAAPPKPPPEATAAPAYRPAPTPSDDGSAAAAVATDRPSPGRRHVGIYIRPDLGYGYLDTSASQGTTSTTISGLAATFGLAVGGAVAEGHILAVHVWDMVVMDPNVSYGTGSVANFDASLSLLGLGPEYTAYSKDNLYLSISPSVTRTWISGNTTTSGKTNWGYGGRVAVGKEWWVAEHWGLGIAGHLSASFNKASGGNGLTWTTFAGALAFSATYN